MPIRQAQTGARGNPSFFIGQIAQDNGDAALTPPEAAQLKRCHTCTLAHGITEPLPIASLELQQISSPPFPPGVFTMTRDEQFEQGLQKRKQVMGEAFVDKAFANADAFTAPLQELVTPQRLGHHVVPRRTRPEDPQPAHPVDADRPRPEHRTQRPCTRRRQ